MLIAFKFKNFRSFYDESGLSLVANKADKSMQSSLLDPRHGKRVQFRLLPAIAIYGANAAGKTNVLKAIDYMRDAVTMSQAIWKPNAGTRLHQNRSANETSATVFEMDFVVDNVRYNYGFSANSRFFEEEWLLAYPLGRERVLFRRETRASGKGDFATQVKCGENFSGDDRYLANIEQRTRENSLFLSAAAQDNQAESRAIFEWFEEFLEIPEMDVNLDYYNSALTSRLAEGHQDFKEALLAMLKTADPSIEDLEVSEREGVPIPETVFQAMDTRMQSFLQEGFKYNVSFIHKDEGRLITLPLSAESKGLQKIYSLAAKILFALKRGEVLIIDELEASMHPHLARLIVDLFQNRETNTGGAQIIFTTHDTNLLDQTLLRRDQIWFVEKGGCRSTLYSLLEFSPRKDESLENGYLLGRYGAIPALGMKDNWLSRLRVPEDAA
ncbi:AAA family ATPase [Microvirga sp. G4-2]|uniref:AAA family ATPase n=1 Tax=Microvirga sp. G4-2 TaxID=3434467 RepID=UPI0040439FE5